MSAASDLMSARLARQRRHRRSSGAARVIIITISVLLAACVIAALSAVGYVVGIANSAPELESLKPQDPGRVSRVYAADGTQLAIIQNHVLRIPIHSSRMPKNVRDATVAIEDERFYDHRGVDFEGVIRAALKNLTSGRAVQGGSTLTMQLIRTLYTGNNEKTFKRKVHEAKLAEELENVHSGREGKEWILTKYLNSVPYGTSGGQEAVGIEAAARAYFDKPAAQLNLAEAALLAGLPQAPTTYNPLRAPEAAKARRNQVLRKMADLGYISEGTATVTMAQPLRLNPSGYFRQRRENFFVDYVTDELIKSYGATRVRSGGLKITTTIDLDLQEKARKAIADSLTFSGAPSSAIVSIDPRNGYIRAMASSQQYERSKFNIAADGKRQPGSAFKIMALAAAVREGVNPATTSFPSAPLKLGPQYGDVEINCYGGRCAGGSKNLIAGTVSSDNGVYIRLALDIGPNKVAKAAHDLGITSKLEGLPAETLGGLSRCCSPLEMANAYATIVDGGWRNKPKAITKVVFPDGTLDDLSEPSRKKVFDEPAMYEIVKILEQNVQRGTGTLARTGCPVGGKTGTTTNNADAWFVGFSPRLATSVWVGFPRAQIPMGPLFHGRNVDGGTFPAQIWGQYMKGAARGFCGKFPKPSKPFKSKPFKGEHSGPVAPPAPTPEELEAKLEEAQRQQEALQEQIESQRGAPQRGAPQSGGQGFDPGDYNSPGGTPPPPPQSQGNANPSGGAGPR